MIRRMEWWKLRQIMPQTSRSTNRKLRFSSAVGFFSLAASLIIAAFTPLPEVAMEGILTMEESSDLVLSQPFCPSIPSGEKVVAGQLIGYRLTCRVRQVLEEMARLRAGQPSEELLDSLDTWRIALNEPKWMEQEPDPMTDEYLSKEWHGLHRELERKQSLLQDARMGWNSASTLQQREEEKNRTLQLESECNALLSRIEAIVRQSERKVPRKGGALTPAASWAASADSALRSMKLLAPEDGFLRAITSMDGSGTAGDFGFISGIDHRYAFHTEGRVPEHFAGDICFLRFRGKVYPVKVLGTEVGPRGSFLRLVTDDSMETGHDWELLTEEPRSAVSLLRYWIGDHSR